MNKSVIFIVVATLAVANTLVIPAKLSPEKLKDILNYAYAQLDSAGIYATLPDIQISNINTVNINLDLDVASANISNTACSITINTQAWAAENDVVLNCNQQS